MSERKGTKGLELWCKRLVDGYPGVKIDNMTTSWRNGLAFCAIIHHFRPDLIDFPSLKVDDIYYNNELAYRTAETHLGIPALLDPEDMVDNDVPDRLSILTYLSQFYQRLGNKGLVKQKSVTPVQGTQISPVTPSHNLNLTRLKSQDRKQGYEKCAKCDLPVYLAQRLLVSHRLYHRGCFRCSKCRVQLSPANCYENETGTEFCCESCKNNETTSALPLDDDKMGMLLFDDHPYEKENIILSKGFDRQKSSLIGPSILEKINAFESRDKMGKSTPLLPLSADQIDGKHLNTREKTKMFDEIKRDTIKSDSNNSSAYLNSTSMVSEKDKISPITNVNKSDLALDRSPDKPSVTDVTLLGDKMVNNLSLASDTPTIPQRRYRNNASKINFMQTQLTAETEKDISPRDVESTKPPPINEDTFPVLLYDFETNKHKDSSISGDVSERAKSSDFKSGGISSNGLDEGNQLSTDVSVMSVQKGDGIKTDSDSFTKDDPVENIPTKNSESEEPILPILPCFVTNGPSVEHADNTAIPNNVEDVKYTNGESVESDKTNTVQVTVTTHEDIHDVEINSVEDVKEPSTTSEFLATNLSDGQDNELNTEKVHSMDLEDASVKCLENKSSDENKNNSTTCEIIFSDPVTLADEDIEPVLVEAVSDVSRKEIDDKTEEDRSPKPAEDGKTYPVHLNPFSDDEEDDVVVKPQPAKRVSTNPFGSSDEEEETPSHPPRKSQTTEKSIAPMKRVIHALNPFWSDGEEPSSEDDAPSTRYSARIKSNWSTSTPSIPVVSPRRKKTKAPKPPNIVLQEVPIPAPRLSRNDEMCSLTSISSHGSTAYSDTTKSLTPKSRKKRPAPTPPSSHSSLQVPPYSPRRGLDEYSDTKPDITREYSLQTHMDQDAEEKSSKWRRHKGPAPGLPLPGRRVVRTELTLSQLQSELDLLEVQQQGLEKQGVLLEQMIREKCEMYHDGIDESVVQEIVKEGADVINDNGEQSVAVPQEVVEDLVIQLCELVNEKNDLFRKQAELMYIRRQQRLEQEQADIEHEIRVIQSRPAVNRIDSDKAREEYLVNRLIAIVRQRDELVQQLDCDRRREIAEDEAIAVSIAQRRASRTTDSNDSSLQSVEITPKKVKVKDRVKKQLKKAKLSSKLHLKKKEIERPEGEAPEKESKTKWF